MYKSMWTSLKLVDSATSATPVADWCIKSNTQPFNPHRHTLTVEWPFWRACEMWNRHRMSVCKISALLELPQSTVSAVFVKWKRLGATTAQLRSGRPHKLTEWDRRELKRVAIVYPRLQHSLRVPSCLEATSASTRTVRQELPENGFHGRAASHKPKITISNTMHRLKWCQACRHWTLEQWK
jgi:transposase